MIFDKESCMNLVKSWLEPKDKKRTVDLTTAMGAALDELSMRLRSESYLTSYSVTVAAAAREKNLSGDNDNLRSIFAMTLGTGDYYRVLIYKDPQQFLRDHNDPSAAAGRPNLFTQLEASDGFPTVRFEVPLTVAETLKVYFWENITPDNVSVARSISAVATGTAAWFYGPGSPEGVPYHAMFRELASLSRASDEFTPAAQTALRQSREDLAIRGVVRNMQLGRK